MTASLRIEHLRARVDPGAQPVAARLALQILVAELGEALPRGLPPQSVLLVRAMRLRVPAVALRQPPDGAARAALREAGRSYLSHCAAVAASPARGQSADHAEAVLFADEAELLACLARDAFAARLDRWWWRQLLGRAFPDWRRAFAARPPACAAALRLLARQFPREADALTRELGWAANPSPGPDRFRGEPLAARADRGRGLPASAAPRLVEAAPGDGVPDALPAVTPSPRHARSFAAASGDTRAVPDSGAPTPPAGRVGAASAPKFAAERRATDAAGGGMRADGRAKAPVAPATLAPSEPGTDGAAPAAAHFGPTLPITGMPGLPWARVEGPVAAPHLAPGAAPGARGPGGHPLRAAPLPAAPADPRPDHSAPGPQRAARGAPVATQRDGSVGPPPQHVDTESTPLDTDPWPQPQPLWSRHARLLLLVNCLLEDGLYPDFTRPLDPGFPLPIWELLLRLGEHLIGPGWRGDPLRAALARRARELPRRALGRLADDWPQGAAARLGGRQPVHARRLRREPKHGLERWLLNYAEALRSRLVERLGLPLRPGRGGSSRAVAAALAGEPACVWWSEGEVVVVFTMNQHPVEWRLAGLDRDPGHLPAAGVKLRFVFE